MATSRPLTPSRTSPFATSTVAPDTPTSLSAQPRTANTLAPISAALTFRKSASPGLQISPRHTSPRPLTGAAALEDQRRMREQQERMAGAQTSPNPNAAAISNLLGQSTSPARGTTAKSSEQIAQMAQKIQIPEPAHHETLQTSPVSMASTASLDLRTSANTSTTGPILAPSLPTLAENPFPVEDPNAPRPAVDAGVPTDSRAFTFPPPPADDPRNYTPHRNMSMPNAGMSSPRSGLAKRHKCPFCSTVFTRHHNLKSHLLTHSQEKPYECQQCQSRFRRLHDLKRHTKLHTGERPHECPKCGRKFARGDALARHNKGQGGCAGRRSSFGMDQDDIEGRSAEAMDDVQYTDEPENMDEGEEAESRRVSHSEASRSRQDSNAYRAGPSTYPPPALGPILSRAAVAPMYHASPAPSTRDTSSPQTHGSSLGSLSHFPPPGLPSSALFQTGVTESPKPISPGHPGPHRGSASGPSGYSHNPRGTGPQLPPLSQAMQPSGYGSMPPPTAGSQPGSLSSGHSGGSGASIREILGPRGGDDWWGYFREMESRMNKMAEDHAATVARIQSEHNRLETDLRTKVNQLESENRALRGSQDTDVRKLQDELTELKGKLGEAARS